MPRWYRRREANDRLSVVVIRLAATSAHVCARLDVALAGTSEALERGAVVVVEETRCRVRELPIRSRE